MNDVLYNLEKQPPLNSLEISLKEKGYIWYATCLTFDEYQVQEQVRSCCKRMANCPGLELVSTQNQWVTRFWMRTQSIAVQRGDISEEQASLPLVTSKRNSAPPPLPTQKPQSLSEVQAVPSLFPDQRVPAGETFTSTSPTVPSDPPEGSIRNPSTLPAPSNRETLPDVTDSGWREPGSATPAIRPPPISETTTSAIQSALDQAIDPPPDSMPTQDVADSELVIT